MTIKKISLWAKALNDLKKISKALNNKEMGSFTLSLKIYEDGFSKPKSFVMEGARSAEGGWKTRTSSERDSDVLYSSDELQEKIQSINKSVDSYIVKNGLVEAWDKEKTDLQNEMSSGLSAEDLGYRNGMAFRAIAGYGYRAHLYAPKLAIAYGIEAEQALVNQDIAHASRCVKRGLSWSEPERFLADPNNRFTERARQGGKHKALAQEPVKEKVAELLTKSQTGGWKSTEEAINTIAKELYADQCKFVESCGLSGYNLARTIREWIKKDPARFPHKIEPNS